ncbi:hypothetical protein ACFLXV_03020 [Chloroflexota bacterium]
MLEYTGDGPDTPDSGRPAPQYVRGKPRILTTAMKQRLIAVFPFLYPPMFAMDPVLTLYASNVSEVSPSEVFMPLVAALGLALTLLLLARVLIRDIRKAALIATLFLVLFFFYGPILSIIRGWAAPGVLQPTPWIILIIVWVIILISGIYLIIRTHRNLAGLTTVLTVVGLLLVMISSINIAVNETNISSQDIRPADSLTLSEPELSIAGTMPDIYYIILDRYAGASTLQEVYDFDNSEFLNFLTDRGFYIAHESRANYLKTRSSLASSLNMGYINYLTEELGEGFTDVGPIYDMLQDYDVWHLLKSMGYEFVHSGSWWGPTRSNEYADINLNYSQIPYFPMILFENTMAYPLCVTSHIFDDRHTRHSKCALYSYENLADIPNIANPTFVFAHLLMPHPPYVFDTDGSCLTIDEAQQRSAATNYVNQLVFTNSKLQLLIDELLSKSDIPPVIILQADEGPFPPGTDSPDFKWEITNEALLKQKMRILNAYYLPDVDDDVLYSSITPVNSFRVVFNSYFGTDLALLPDTSYVIHGGHPYKFLDITDVVDYE